MIRIRIERWDRAGRVVSVTERDEPYFRAGYFLRTNKQLRDEFDIAMHAGHKIIIENVEAQHE